MNGECGSTSVNVFLFESGRHFCTHCLCLITSATVGIGFWMKS